MTFLEDHVQTKVTSILVSHSSVTALAEFSSHSLKTCQWLLSIVAKYIRVCGDVHDTLRRTGAGCTHHDPDHKPLIIFILTGHAD